MQRACLAVTATAVLGVAACGSLLANEVDPTADAADGGDGGSAAMLDGASSTSTVPVIDPDAGATPAPCTARFCASFDDGDAGPLFGFKRFGPGDHDVASFGVRGDVALSAPSSYRVVTDGESTEGWLELELGDALSGSVHLAVWADALADDKSTKIVTLNCDEGDAARVRIESGAQLAISGSDNDSTTFGTVPTQKWIPIDLDFTKDALGDDVAARATLHVGSQSHTVGRPDCSPPLRVRIGLAPVEPASFDLSFDDVAIDWNP